MKHLSVALSLALALASGAALAQPQDSHTTKWSAGQTLPNHYFAKSFAATDWRDRHLASPNDDQRWVVDEDGNYILASLGTHMIQAVVAKGDHP